MSDTPYAIVKCGGKQIKVAKGSRVVVEKIGDGVGSAVSLSDVLMVVNGSDIKIGTPLLAGASVSATVVEQRKGPKIIIFKKRRRQNSRRKNGHRQPETVLEITAINN
jgi:large subunit ribosomal protein L21